MCNPPEATRHHNLMKLLILLPLRADLLYILQYETPCISLRNIKMAPKRVFEWIALSSWRQNYTLQLNICHEACKLQTGWSIMSKISKHWPIFSIQIFAVVTKNVCINQFSEFHNVISLKVSWGISRWCHGQVLFSAVSLHFRHLRGRLSSGP